MDRTFRREGGRVAIVIGCFTGLIAAGCGSNDDGSGIEDPLIQEGANVIPSGTGSGSSPAARADSVGGAIGRADPAAAVAPEQEGFSGDTTR